MWWALPHLRPVFVLIPSVSLPSPLWLSRLARLLPDGQGLLVLVWVLHIPAVRVPNLWPGKAAIDGLCWLRDGQGGLAPGSLLPGLWRRHVGAAVVIVLHQGATPDCTNG